MIRRRVSAVHNEFVGELDRLIRLDAQNQKRLALQAGRPPSGSISKRQLETLTEGVFMRTFRSYEIFIRDLFILYSMGKGTLSGNPIISYIRPQSFFHAEEIVSSDKGVTNWTSPSVLNSRTEKFLGRTNPLRISVTSYYSMLEEIKRIRNFIAHSGSEAESTFKTELRSHFGTMPRRIPTAGEYLCFQSRQNPNKHYVVHYLENLKLFAGTAAN